MAKKSNKNLYSAQSIFGKYVCRELTWGPKETPAQKAARRKKIAALYKDIDEYIEQA